MRTREEDESVEVRGGRALAFPYFGIIVRVRVVLSA
jgi:hypothetical protein